MALTNVFISKLTANGKTQRHFDSGGLYLEVSPAGGKWWRFKYRIVQKEKRLSFGTFPDVSLKDARERRDEARKLVRNGVDPSSQRQDSRATEIERAENSFEKVARTWFEKMRPTWAPSHSSKIIRRLEVDVFPWLGVRPIAEITAPEVLACANRVAEQRNAKDTAHRVVQNCGQVFQYAVASGLAQSNPCQHLRGALPALTHKHFATILDSAEIGALLRAMDAFQGTFVVKCALRLAPMLFVRPGELRQARWEDVDLDAGLWTYWVTKTKFDFIVPLSLQAVDLLRELKQLTGRSEFVFPGARSNGKPMSGAAVNAALQRMGYDTEDEITGHGFRAMARTVLVETLGCDETIVEFQLAHRPTGYLGGTYNRAKYLPQRREMMQQWSDFLGEVKQGAKIMRFPVAA